MHRRARSALAAAIRCALSCALMLISATWSAAGLAQVDDRDNSTPTAWWDFSGMTDTDINTFAANNNARLVDIQLEAVASPRRFTVTFVSNTGAYAKSWFWYYDVTATTLNSIFANNNLRPIALKAYDVGGGDIRFAAVMIPNTGADAKTWFWYYNQTPADIITNTTNTNARLVNINAYVTGGATRYAVVMVSNTGADQRTWFWYFNVSPAQIVSFSNANQARIIDLDLDPSTGNYNVIMNGCSSGCPDWWWYFGLTAQQVNDITTQNGARIIDFNSSPGCGARCYAMVLINNSNAITTRVGDLLRNGTDGIKGLYLKQVGGPVLANLEETHAFEPASAMKAVHHVYSMHQIQNGAAQLTTSITQYQPPASGSCPGNTPIGTESLQTAMGEMMRHSDNTRTREIEDFFGRANIVAYAQGFGMTSTQINHTLGCGGPIPNQTTLTDLATLYEGVANGTLLNATNRATFYSLMAGKAQFLLEGYDWTHLWDTDIPNIIEQEAPAGMYAAVKTAFRDKMNLAYKAGNYKICGATCATYVDHIAIAGWAKIPFCVGATVVPKEFVFGLFINNSTSDTLSSNTFNTTKAELLREQIHDGLASCASANRTFDVDGNSGYDALTDGMLVLRYESGVQAPALLAGTIGPNATRTNASGVQTWLDYLSFSLDIDGNGQIDPATDGVLVLRYMLGLRGTALVAGVIGAGALRTTAAQIEPYLQSLMP